MGRGNWIPDTPIYQGDYDLVYVELQDVCESSPDCDEIDWLYADFKRNIAAVLPKSFRPVERGERCKYLGRDTVVLFANDSAHGGHGLPGRLLAPRACDCGP